MGHKNIQHTVRYTEMVPDRFKRNTAKIATVAKARSRKRATDEERA
jgi:hypothetical protein